MTENFDLFGHPVPDWKGKRGRPPYEPTDRDRNKIKLLLALGWSIPRMANGIGVSPATVKRYFRAELKVRDAMRDRLEARRFELAMEQANAGNVAALKLLGAMIDRNDLMETERRLAETTPRPAGGEERSERLGKKQVDEIRARAADADLMADLEREAAANARH